MIKVTCKKVFESYYALTKMFGFFQNPLYGGALAIGDSATDDSRQRLTSFKDQLNKMIEGESLPFSIILDDPAGNSYLQVNHRKFKNSSTF